MVDSDDDSSDESDVHDDEEEREKELNRESMKGITLGGGEDAEDETPIEQLMESFDKIRRKWETHWQAGLRYYTQIGLLEGDDTDEN